ncbi:SAM-dependent methyltransferase [Enterococcus sp. JM4C]|uniref:class I SAM-dependent rRNA methyltransferase n=1 Tax=Candidatus Enterococcus huntleyi TaxID=1857217 RepID=UPI00137A3FD4|nr:class I SAM-dependent rRNA methyltransferase [Enterococcus sp. JM4C]KAF1297477.1 SAM-dependent methyltransferase [Enterococcus sp. JM4C]
MEIRVTKQAEKKLRRGYPLLQKEDLVREVKPTKQWVSFVNEAGRFLAKGYLGEQNKGIGWVLSNKDEPIQLAFFAKLFTTAKKARERYFLDETTTAFRIFNGEGDGLGGLIIDLYESYAVFSWYNQTLFQNKEEIVAAFKQVFPEVVGAYEKIRFSDGKLPESQWLYGKEAPEPLLVKENNITYATYLNEGLMTGIFLDQKEVREALSMGLVAGKSLLNMFSYTGAFSVAAKMGGASQTTSVDLAKRSLPKTREQFEVNGLGLEENKIVVMDVFEYFKYAARKDLHFDVIVLDPPSFARNKKKVFSVAKNYGDLVEDSVDILSAEGLLVASTNAANVSREKFQKMIEESLKNKQVRFKKVNEYQLPADFKTIPEFEEGNYLKVFFYKITK